MNDKTTIKVDRATVDGLHGIKGHLDWTKAPERHTLNDTLVYLINEYYKTHKLKGGEINENAKNICN